MKKLLLFLLLPLLLFTSCSSGNKYSDWKNYSYKRDKTVYVWRNDIQIFTSDKDSTDGYSIISEYENKILFMYNRKRPEYNFYDCITIYAAIITETGMYFGNIEHNTLYFYVRV